MRISANRDTCSKQGNDISSHACTVHTYLLSDNVTVLIAYPIPDPITLFGGVILVLGPDPALLHTVTLVGFDALCV